MPTRFKEHLVLIKDVLTSLSLFSAAVVTVLTFIWTIAGDNIISYAKDGLGITELQQRQDALKEEVQNKINDYENNQHLILQKLTLLDKKIAEAYPNLVTEFDTIRSMVTDTECHVGQECKFQMRLRRTPLGLTCPKPVIEGFVVNHYGIVHPVDVRWPNTTVNDDWFIIEGSFMVTPSIMPGLSQFYVTRTFRDCPPDFTNPVSEDSPALTFRVN